MTTEVFGDATRGGAWAAVSLTVEDERIVAADAPRIDRALVGLTLLEAAAVGGEPLAVEALAAALGQVFVASPRPGRIAVAMSGGVDSAVALLRAGPGGRRSVSPCVSGRTPRRPTRSARAARPRPWLPPARPATPSDVRT